MEVAVLGEDVMIIDDGEGTSSSSMLLFMLLSR